MKFEDLTPDQQDKARACKSAEDVLALAREEGYELSDEQLEAVSGGDWDCWTICSAFKKDQTCDLYGPGM